MRVTHVITRLIVGGAQENTIATVLGLHKKKDVSVDLVSGPTTGSEGSLESAVHEHSLLSEEPNLIRAVHPPRDFLAYRGLTRRFLETQPDIVHTHSGKAGVLARLAAHAAGVPIIIHTIHGPSFGSFQDSLNNLIFRSAERRAGRVTTHFVSVADAMTRQYLKARIGQPWQYSTIRSGFDLEPFLHAKNNPKLRSQLGISPDDFVVGKIARLFKLKGHEDLFAVAEELVKTNPDMKFLLIGDGPWRERFEQYLAIHGLSANFIFTGLVPPGEVHKYVGIMNCLAHLSLREGLPRALPQAMAAGKSVVAYDCDGAREVCLDRKTGFLIKPGDKTALTEALKTLSTSRELRHQYGEEGRALVRTQFDQENMVEQIYDLYVKLMKDHQS